MTRYGYGDRKPRVTSALTEGATTVAQLNRIPLIARLTRLPGGMRRLGPLALALGLVVVVAILLGPIAHQQPGASATSQVGAASMLVARADVHVETMSNGKDLELNVAITQTQNDCQAPLNGGVCLRYSVVEEEQPVMVGYGVIPQANVRVTPTNIVLKVDTRKVPGFVNVVGSGGVISVTWKNLSPTARVGVMHKVTAQGGIASYTLVSNGMIATMLVK